MTTPLPRDPALPGLWALLDEQVMGQMLGARLGVTLTAVRPKYVRYKPGTSCIVQYDLSLVGDDGLEETTGAHIKLFADGRARDKAFSGRSERLLERAKDVLQSLRGVAYIPEVEGFLQVYPIDHDLRYLSRVADPAQAQGILRKALGEHRDVALADAPDLIRYKPERKALLRYSLADGSTVYGKVFADDRAGRIAAHTNALTEAGFSTSPLAGVLAGRNFVVHEEVFGDQLASLRGEPGYRDLMRPLAESLWRFHETAVPGLLVHRLADEVAALEQVSRLLGQIVPDLAPRLDRLYRDLAVRLMGQDELLVTAHGDFYDDQAIVSPDGMAIIDLDEMRLSHPLIDAGNMLAHLAVQPAAGDAVVEGREVFLEETRRRYPDPGGDLAAFEAAALLKLAPGPFRRLEDGWPGGIERIVSLAETRLASTPAPVSSGGPAKPKVTISDPALPQLATLQDSAAMTARMPEALGGVRDVEVARHKPGRRAILRYGLDSGEVLYGKTFASSRGPKVYDIARIIAGAKAFGPDVALPDPVAWLPEVKLLLQREVRGEPVERPLLEGDRDLVIRIAFALYQFHSSGIELGRSHDLTKELDPLARRVEEVAGVDAVMGERARDCLERIREMGGESFRWRSLAVHRDMYHEQVMRDGDRLVVLDLDDASMSEPLVDVANFSAHLMLLGAQRHGDVAALDSVNDAFLEQYAQLDAGFDHDMLEFLTATTLVRLAGIHVTRANGTRVAGMLLDASERCLDRLAWVKLTA